VVETVLHFFSVMPGGRVCVGQPGTKEKTPIAPFLITLAEEDRPLQ
jgi:hypothetical protein